MEQFLNEKGCVKESSIGGAFYIEISVENVSSVQVQGFIDNVCELGELGKVGGRLGSSFGLDCGNLGHATNFIRFAIKSGMKRLGRNIENCIFENFLR